VGLDKKRKCSDSNRDLVRFREFVAEGVSVFCNATETNLAPAWLVRAITHKNDPEVGRALDALLADLLEKCAGFSSHLHHIPGIMGLSSIFENRRGARNRLP
jgi:hypothetical protein